MASYDDTATVSGSVVSFPNGADDVPTKSLVVTIPPTLSGESSVTEKQTGRNLVDGYVDYSNVNKVVEPQFYKAGTYTFSCVRATNINGIYVRKGSVIDLTAESVSSKYNTLTNTFTISEEGYYFIQLYRSTSSPTWEDEPVTNVQLEIGSTAHAYEQYQTPTQYTASLGRTIYGGQVDIVNGTGTDGFGIITFDGSSDENWQDYSSYNGFYIAISQMKVGTRQDGVSNYLTNSQTSAHTQDTYWLGVNSNRLFLIEVYNTMGNNITALRSYLSEHPLTVVFPLATPPDFTFDGQEIPTKLGYNAFWSDQGNTELTYYKSGYGFTSVTVNKTGKNLWSSGKDLSITRDKTMYMRIPRGTYTLSFDFISSTASPVPSYMQVAYSTTDGTKYNPVTVVEGRCSRTFTLSADARALTIYSSTSYSASVGVTTVVNNIQLEVGSQASSYEPYEVVSKTAYLHKVIYGGTADVVNGTCEPKNLLPMTNYDGGVYNPDVGRQLNLTVSQTQFEKTGGVYSVSTTSTWKTFTVLFPIISGATYYEKWTLSVESGQQGSIRAYLDEDFKVLAKYNNNSSDPITTNGVMSPPTGAKYLAITWTNRGTAVQTLNITEPQIEKGTSASDFAPYFEPFSFPPISIGTDEGENTLFSNEGTSAITYRKETE